MKRWSAGGKKEVVLCLLRNEPVDDLSREVSVPIYKLEQWRDRALASIDAGLKERERDPVSAQLDDANRRIGELVMESEILRKERPARRPLVGRRSRGSSRGPPAEQARATATVAPLFLVRRGPKPKMADADRRAAIRTDLATSPFTGEGHRKVWARRRILRGIRVSRTRVLRLDVREPVALAPSTAHGCPQSARRHHHHGSAERHVGYRRHSDRDGGR
ncbi:MAG: hypothetical protein ACSLE5_13190 [Porticoccaceae bacterium]